VTDEEIDAAFKLLEDLYEEYNVDISDHPFWVRIYNEPGFKDEVVEDIKSKMEYAIHMHAELNEAVNNH
jgi:hypothetical protein